MITRNSIIYIVLYILMIVAHYGICNHLGIDFQKYFYKYYIFLTMLFVLTTSTLSIIRPIYLNYVGFAFLGLIMVKLSLSIVMSNKLHLKEFPYTRLHYILPYLFSLFLETLYAVDLIQKDEKNH